MNQALKNVCPECTYRNRAGELFCQECGNPLFGEYKPRQKKQEGISTRQLSVSGSTSNNTPRSWGGTASLSRDGELVLHFKGHEDPLVLQPQSEMILGRADNRSGHHPDIDLSPYGALEEGVSRSHARLQREGSTLTLADLDSVNGTFLNNQQIPAQQARVLHDGDEIRLGRLTFYIYFK